MSKLRCVIDRVTYQNPENGYCILKATAEGYSEPVTLVGILNEVSVGSVLLCDGEWKTDKRYGRQFQCAAWEEAMPATIYGIEKYLGSGLIKGIGPKYAKLIVNQFGTETINIIENEIERLHEVPGLGRKRIEKIADNWEKQKGIKNVMIFLQGFGISTAYAAKIFHQYGKDSVEKVKGNPYHLADEVWGIGFKMADSIASKMGYEKNDLRRCQSGIFYTMNQLMADGHVFATDTQLMEATRQLLEIDGESISVCMQKMIANKELVLDSQAIYLPHMFHAECDVAHRLVFLSKQANTSDSLFNNNIDITGLQKQTNIAYDEVQVNAIRQAIASKVMVLTGGPGTGKTTTTKAIIAALQHSGLHILLAAPTGRAAKRMSEATGMEAKTIHRLLEFNPADGYKRCEDNPLEGDALIVDECSMIDLNLMHNLLLAIPRTMRLILVGDIDQLPSVGAGNVLRDIIQSGCVPVVRLTRIFRQAQQSRIVTNAHAINQGLLPDLSNGRHTDFFFIKNDDAESAVLQIVSLVQHRLGKAYHTSPTNIQVLTPMQRGVVGAANLNLCLQQALNPQGPSINRGNCIFRQGDRIMQLRNNYDKDVYNGDLGYVTAVNEVERTLTACFDDKFVEYEAGELDELTLAYATTIHKSQGSEYPIVVMPVLMNHYVMLQRNLIYTGITRAKKICVLVGSSKALAYAVHNTMAQKRNTKLKERIASAL